MIPNNDLATGAAEYGAVDAVEESSERRRTLRSLLERVKGLSGPDRDVDRAVLDALETPNLGWGSIWPASVTWDSTDEGKWAAPLSASLDAVVALCERLVPDYRWHLANRDYVDGVYQGDGFGAWLEHPVSSGGGPDWHAHGATPALALLAALLSALVESHSEVAL